MINSTPIRLDRNEIKHNLDEFRVHWRQRLDTWKENGEGAIEKKYAQSFWAAFLACFGISATRMDLFEQDARRGSTGNTGYIDLFWPSVVIGEAKSPGVNLDEAVTNAYATLWQEYKEVRSSTTLLNVMRRILEHYFLQLCGHDGVDLRTHILETHRDKFIRNKDDGTEDLTDLRQAESILAYLNHEMTGLGDDTFYIEHAADPETCRSVFRRIFTHMGQEQHYNMMMNPAPSVHAPPSPVGASNKHNPAN